MSDTTYMRSFTQIHDSVAPDDLIAGWYTANPIQLASGAGLKRVMSSGDNIFTAAEKAGISNAYELAVLCENIPEDAEDCATTAYFSGIIKWTSIILPYETETDIHSEQIEAIRPALRRAGFIVL